MSVRAGYRIYLFTGHRHVLRRYYWVLIHIGSMCVKFQYQRAHLGETVKYREWMGSQRGQNEAQDSRLGQPGGCRDDFTERQKEVLFSVGWKMFWINYKMLNLRILKGLFCYVLFNKWNYIFLFFTETVKYQKTFCSPNVDSTRPWCSVHSSPIPSSRSLYRGGALGSVLYYVWCLKWQNALYPWLDLFNCCELYFMCLTRAYRWNWLAPWLFRRTSKFLTTLQY